MFPWANDKIRIHYWIPINDPNYKVEFVNSLGIDMNKTDEELTTVFYKR